MKANKNIFLGLGTNIGDRESNLKIAINEIERIAKIIKKSSIYETEPVGYKPQNDFLNMVIKIETQLNPQELLEALQKIEQKMGRKKDRIKNGPRIIDIDILFYGTKKINSKNLKIPHPEAGKRNFVLIPMAEISARKTHPLLKIFKTHRDSLNK